MTETLDLNNNLCKTCKFRFRRVFMPLRPEEYLDEDGNRVLSDDDNIIITNQCLLTSMDLDGDITIECTSHEPKKGKKEIESTTFFKHIK